MNLFFKIFFLILIKQTYAITPIELCYTNNLESAEMAKKVLTKTYSFPIELIEIKKNESGCVQDKETVLQIFCDDQYNFKILNFNKYILSNSFKLFTERNNHDDSTK